MTFKGMNIGLEPTLTQIEVYICEKGFNIEPKDVYDHYKTLNWCTRKGQPLKTLEAMCDAYNGVFVHRELKRQKYQAQKAKKAKVKGNIKQKIQKLEEINKEKKPHEDYNRQLSDSRWKAFRQFVFAVRGKECEMCGKKVNLQVHHLKYNNGCMAWEYTCNDVIVVCGDCHKKIHNIK